MTHPDPIAGAVAAGRHAAGWGYAVLLSARERPLALIERWPRGMWGVYLYDDSGRRELPIELKPSEDGGTPALIAHQRAGTPEDAAVRRLAEFRCPEPEFGEWQVFLPLLALQGHEPATTPVVLTDVSVEGGSPLRPIGIEQLFSPGPRDTPDGPATVEVIDAGLLGIPSGQLAVADPGVVDSTARSVPVPPGGYPVTLALLHKRHGPKVAAARVTILDISPAVWSMALRPNEDPGLLGRDRFYGIGVDSGSAAFMDATRRVPDPEIDETVFIPQSRELAMEFLATDDTSNLIAFYSGEGDGSYPVWTGHTADGEVACVVIDFMLLRPRRRRSQL
ncbi:DUF4241 domain-containing protein [Streptomyces smaragdinus]|uniref:DUF4241 domain-containing protein n=1 Tax=Streptomyces smaragdinus TaxID=2585196 RepID=UPI001294BC0E|nr:DUF4241 domain-containing protein [Streptomyces smaragdinus]